NGQCGPLRDAKVRVRTHAFNDGTGVFEGIRAYWNPEHGQLYGLHLLEHYRRLHKSCRVMRLDLPYTAERLVEITVELLVRSGYREDCYVRPLVYKSSELIGVRLHDLDSSFIVFVVSFVTYIEDDSGISCSVSCRRRFDDIELPG